MFEELRALDPVTVKVLFSPGYEMSGTGQSPSPPSVKPALTCSLPPPPPSAKLVSYGYSAVPVQLITHKMPLRPVTYIPPASAVCYEYSYPAVKPVVPTVLKTPMVPLKPVQYMTFAPPYSEHSTPTPLKTKYSTTVPAVSYEYVPPAPVKPFKPMCN
ncbi:uncharacterized protein LOC128989205 [Macrosteles quadrilineatus]|uniref:uncharacterized protein LOC128989205 n=1 Tax=Macrosteles quadrilineatus TaxID=74068 RepID=UPI0023E30F03|nr:uncharacterized protein LOC128989205 [Macrosteles quadrilineatus]